MTDLPPQSVVLRDSLRVASEAGVSVQAVALLAVIVSESWAEQGAWVAKLGFPVLRKRLGNCSRDSIRRWADELERAEIVRHRSGDGHRVSRWTVTVSTKRGGAPMHPPGRTSAPPGGAPMHPPGRTSAPPGGAPMHPVSEQTELSAAASAEQSDAAAEKISPDQERKNWRLLARPEWCSSSPWLDDRARREISKTTDEVTIRWAVIETKRSRSNLDNPAGFLRSLIRNPDAWAVDQLRERLANRAAERT